MISVNTKLKRLQYAALTLAAMMAASSAYAAGTLSGIPVNNTATVAYDVATIPQEAIESSPTGNTASGVGNGTPTSFVVDNVVDLSVAEIGGTPTTTTPGATLVLTTFRVTNEGNTPQDYALSVVNLTSTDPTVHGNGDTDVDMSTFQIFVDTNDDDGFVAVDDTDTFIDGLAPDADIEVFVLATAPLGALTTDFANIRLTATTYDDGSDATGAATAETAGADTTSVDVVFGDANGGDGFEFADDGYTFATANLEISKISTVIEDPFNGTTNPKAIPGAFVEYTITLTNNGTVDADSVVLTDTLASEVTALVAQYNGGAADIEIQPEGAASIFCTFDATGDSDGCGLVSTGPSGEGGDLTIDLPSGLTIGTAPTANQATILFRVEIL